MIITDPDAVVPGTQTWQASFFYFMTEKHIVFSIYHPHPSCLSKQGLGYHSASHGPRFCQFSTDKATCSCLSDVTSNRLFTQRRMNTAESIFRGCLVCTLLLAALHQMRAPIDTDYRSQLKKSCLQALHGKQQGTPCCMPPCCFLLYYKCLVLWDKMKGVRL